MRLLLRIFIASLMVLLLVATIGFAVGAEAAVPQVALIIVEPNEILNSTLTAGSAFRVDVNVNNVTNLFGWQLLVKYNTTAVSTSRESVAFGPIGWIK